MAKFSRFDPRNKKKNRHKRLSLERQPKIHKLKPKDLSLTQHEQA